MNITIQKCNHDSIDMYFKQRFPKYKLADSYNKTFKKYSKFKYLKLWLLNFRDIYQLHKKTKIMDKVARDILEAQPLEIVILTSICQPYIMPKPYLYFLKTFYQCDEISKFNRKVDRNNKRLLEMINIIANHYDEKKYCVHLSNVENEYGLNYVVLLIRSKYNHQEYPTDYNYSEYMQEDYKKDYD